MSYHYPQAAVILRVLWEDFGLASGPSPRDDDRLNKLGRIYTLPIIARRLSVNINDYTQADTFDCEIDYKSFPFDPRCIRACGVSIFIQDMGKVYESTNKLHMLEPSPDNIVFQGFVDEESISFDEEKRTVRFEGRDFTSLLIDRKYLGQPIATSTPLDVLLGQLLADLKETQDLKLENRTGKPMPTIAQFAPDFHASSTAKNVQRDDTYWDVIQDLVGRAGLIAYIEIDKLVVSTPRVLYDKTQTKQFIYGQNVKTLEYKRKLGRHKGFNIVLRSYNLENAKGVEEARIPEEATVDWSRSTGVPAKRVQVPVINKDGSSAQPKDAPFIAFLIPKQTKKQLIETGQKIYEEMSRQQIEGSFTTHNMTIPERSGPAFLATKIRNGTPVSIEIDAGDLEGISRLKSVDERERYLKRRAYDPQVARGLAETMGKFTTPFYTKAVQFTVDQDQGFSMKLDFINFIELDNKGLGIG